MLDQGTERELIRLRSLRAKCSKELDLASISVVEGLIWEMNQLLVIKSDHLLLTLIFVVDSDAFQWLTTPRHPRLRFNFGCFFVFFCFGSSKLLCEIHPNLWYTSLSGDVVRVLGHVFISLVVACLMVVRLVAEIVIDDVLLLLSTCFSRRSWFINDCGLRQGGQTLPQRGSFDFQVLCVTFHVVQCVHHLRAYINLPSSRRYLLLLLLRRLLKINLNSWLLVREKTFECRGCCRKFLQWLLLRERRHRKGSCACKRHLCFIQFHQICYSLKVRIALNYLSQSLSLLLFAKNQHLWDLLVNKGVRWWYLTCVLKPYVIVNSRELPILYLLLLLVKVLFQDRYCIDVWEDLLNELWCRNFEAFSFEAMTLYRVGSCLFFSEESFFSKDLTCTK